MWQVYLVQTRWHKLFSNKYALIYRHTIALDRRTALSRHIMRAKMVRVLLMFM